jgi:hypothetical protein
MFYFKTKTTATKSKIGNRSEKYHDLSEGIHMDTQ